jgi:hypothetical protein
MVHPFPADSDAPSVSYHDCICVGICSCLLSVCPVLIQTLSTMAFKSCSLVTPLPINYFLFFKMVVTVLEP